VSAGLLYLDGAFGLRGWQWLFIVEAIPAIAAGVAALFLLPDRPAHASWLSGQQRAWLEQRLGEESRLAATVPRPSVWEILRDPTVLLLALTWAGAVGVGYALTFFQ